MVTFALSSYLQLQTVQAAVECCSVSDAAESNLHLLYGQRLQVAGAQTSFPCGRHWWHAD